MAEVAYGIYTMEFFVTEVAQWLEHQTLGNTILLGFILTFWVRLHRNLKKNSYRFLNYTKLNIVGSYPFVNLNYNISKNIKLEKNRSI